VYYIEVEIKLGPRTRIRQAQTTRLTKDLYSIVPTQRLGQALYLSQEPKHAASRGRDPLF